MDTKVDTGASAPQFSMSVWRSDEARFQPVAALLFALLGILFGVAGLFGGEPGLAIGGFAGGALLLWLWRFLKRRARVELKIGFDRGADSVWAKRSIDRAPSSVGGLSTVSGFSVEKSSTMRSQYMGGPMGGPLHRAKVRKDSWLLVAKKTDGAAAHLFTFFTKKQAEEALERTNALFASLGPRA